MRNLKFPRKQKKAPKPNLIDERTIKIFKLVPFLQGDKYHSGIIPKGEINTLSEVKNLQGETIGDIEIGTDGFIEAMFIYEGLFFKIKKYPKKECFVILVNKKKLLKNDVESKSEPKQQK